MMLNLHNLFSAFIVSIIASCFLFSTLHSPLFFCFSTYINLHLYNSTLQSIQFLFNSFHINVTLVANRIQSLINLHAHLLLRLRQLLGRGKHTYNALCGCVLSILCELLNQLLTTAWSELRQWLVNTLQWMKGLGIKWQDVLKEEQVVVEKGSAKPHRNGRSCISQRLLLFFLHTLHLHALSMPFSIFHTCQWQLVSSCSFPWLSITLSPRSLSLLSTSIQEEDLAP